MSRQVEIIGLGLMGMSLGLGLRRAGFEVYGQDLDKTAEAFAGARGISVGPAPSPLWAVVAVPMEAVGQVLEDLAHRLPDHTIVTDLASVKTPILPALARLPERLAVVSSHPMAGTEGRGFQEARDNLYQNRTWALIPVPGRPAPWKPMQDLVEALGARLVTVDAELHDRMVAFTSHVPYLMAMALTGSMNEAPPGWADMVGPGFLSATRTAQSSPDLWRQILQANRRSVSEALAVLKAEIETWERLLGVNDSDALEAHIQAIAEVRRQWKIGSP